MQTTPRYACVKFEWIPFSGGEVNFRTTIWAVDQAEPAHLAASTKSNTYRSPFHVRPIKLVTGKKRWHGHEYTLWPLTHYTNSLVLKMTIKIHGSCSPTRTQYILWNGPGVRIVFKCRSCIQVSIYLEYLRGKYHPQPTEKVQILCIIYRLLLTFDLLLGGMYIGFTIPASHTSTLVGAGFRSWDTKILNYYTKQKNFVTA